MSDEQSISGLKERRWGMVIDIDLCTGCGACVAACKVENNIPETPPEQAQLGRTLQWVRLARDHEPSAETTSESFYPSMCYHCSNPPCTKVCPVHATYQGIDGIVGQTYARCIGCRYCMAACPYTAKVFNWFEPQRSPEHEKHTNPDVSLRPKGVVEKCTFCSHRLQVARDDAACDNRDVAESDYQPACVEICPARAMVFGDLEDEHGLAAKASRNPRRYTVLEELGTDPSVIYLHERERRV